MKIQSYLVFLFVALISCKKDEPLNDPIPPEGIEKKVLVEEFTGVNCSACPAASVELEKLIDIYGDNLVTISIHSGYFSIPDSQSVFDFRTQDGDNLFTYLDSPLAFPTAVLNRTIFEDKTDLFTFTNEWAGYIASQFELKPICNFELSQNYNSVSRDLTFDIDGVFEEASTEAVYISAVITESGILDGQNTPTPVGWVNDYVHKHVFRGAITHFSGDLLEDSFEAGDNFSKSFSFTIPQEWNVSNCELIVYLHYNGDSREILQVESAQLEE